MRHMSSSFPCTNSKHSYFHYMSFTFRIIPSRSPLCFIFFLQFFWLIKMSLSSHRPPPLINPSSHLHLHHYHRVKCLHKIFTPLFIPPSFFRFQPRHFPLFLRNRKLRSVRFHFIVVVLLDVFTYVTLTCSAHHHSMQPCEDVIGSFSDVVFCIQYIKPLPNCPTK